MTMNNECQLSIIVPVYNTALYLERCIQSIQTQKLKDIEILAVDDGSTDDSWEVLKKISQTDKRVKIYHQENEGVSSARNFGIEKSCGEWITFIDSDDYVDEMSIFKMVKAVQEKACDIGVYAFQRELGETAEIDSLPWNNEVLNHGDVLEKVIPLMISSTQQTQSISGSVCRSIFRKKLIENIRFNENVSIQEDLIFCLDAYSCANKILFKNDCIYHYVKHQETTTEHYRKNYYNESLAFEEIIVNTLKKIGVFEKVRKKYWSKRIGMYSLCISNLFRADAPKSINGELSEILNGFKKDAYINNDTDYRMLNKKKRLIYILLKLNNPFVITSVYSLKEKKRRKRLSN